MTKWIISRYNHKIAYLKDYTDDYIIYDRSEKPLEGSIQVPNIGSDLYDKFSYVIDNYDNLPEVAVYTKANIFDYIKPREFEKIKDNTTFTPILSFDHPLRMCDWDLTKRFNYYKDGIYWEFNMPGYLKSHPMKDLKTPLTYDQYQDHPLVKMLGLSDLEYIPFAPGSNYILLKKNILKHSKEFYEKLRSYLGWKEGYSGEDMVIERGLYNLWK